MNEETEKSLNGELEIDLKDWFSGFKSAVIVGIGNPLRRDDFVGTKIVRNMRNKISASVNLIECETVPESFMQPIIKLNPSHILIVDAALLNQEPGTAKLVSHTELKEQQVVSTHALPLRVSCQHLEQMTEAKIALLLIQPKDTSFGESLTQKLEKTAKLLAEFLSEILSD